MKDENINTDLTEQEKLVRQIAESKAPWDISWSAENFFNTTPYSTRTMESYRGMNRLALIGAGFFDPRWYTAADIQDLSLELVPGADGRLVEFWSENLSVPLSDSAGRPIMSGDGVRETESADLDKPVLKRTLLYNGSQLSRGGMPLERFQTLEEKTELSAVPPVDIAESIFDKFGVHIVEDQKDKIFSTDARSIHMPPRESFKDESYFYSAAVRQLVKENADYGNTNGIFPFFSKEFSEMNRLKTEMITWTFCQELGLPFEPDSKTEPYSPDFLARLKSDPEIVSRFMAEAESAVDGLYAGPSIAPRRDNFNPSRHDIGALSVLLAGNPGLSEQVNWNARGLGAKDWTGVKWETLPGSEGVSFVTGLELDRKQLSGSLNFNSFHFLERLNISDNKISSLDVSKNIFLSDLDCRSNQIEELVVLDNESLKSLCAANNLIKQIDVTNNQELIDLNLAHNKLSHVGLSGNQKLKNICLPYNQISEIDVSNNKALEELRVFHNRITSLDLEANQKLQILETSYCHIEEIKFPLDSSLTHIFADNNSMVNLDISNCHNLEHLSVSYNNLYIIDLNKNIHINNLSLSNNNLSVLDLSKNNKLNHLYLDSNNIFKLDVSNIPDLVTFSADGNRLIEIDISDKNHLKTVSLSSNNLECLSVVNNERLENLCCDKNQISLLKFSGNSELKKFYAQENKLSQIDISGSPLLEDLDISKNRLVEIDVSENFRLNSLNLCGNDLVKLDVSNNVNLVDLRLKDNQLESLDVTKNTNLNYLSIRNNKFNDFDVDLSQNEELIYVEDSQQEFVDLRFGVVYEQSQREALVAALSPENDPQGRVNWKDNPLDPGDWTGVIWEEESEDYRILHVRHIDLSSMRLEGDLDFSPFNHLKTLNVSQNYLTGLNVTMNDDLEILDASHNEIKELDLLKNVSLKNLNLSKNELTKIALSNNSNLQSLNISDNRLSEINIYRNPLLEELKLSGSIFDGNKLSSIDISNNKILTSLNLTNNNLSEIDISNNPNLNELDVDNNKLEKLDLSKNQALQYLSVNNNNLSRLDVSNNHNLVCLEVSKNRLYELDVSNNSSLAHLYLNDNQVVNLDLSNNSMLNMLRVEKNQIRELDLSNNPRLFSLNNISVDNAELLKMGGGGLKIGSEALGQLEPPMPVRTDISSERTYLRISYEERKEARNLGCDFDHGKKLWFAPAGVPLEPLKKWMPGAEKTQGPMAEIKNYLRVPFAEKDEAGSLGAKFDYSAKLWYVPEDKDPSKFQKWAPKAALVSEGYLDPVDDFKKAMEHQGFEVDVPIMDGEIHRVPISGSAYGSKDGAYKAHADGRPNGWFKNFKTGEEFKWLFTNHQLTPEQVQIIKTQAEINKRLQKEKKVLDQTEAVNKAEKRIQANFKNKASDLETHPYLVKKEISAPEGVLYEKFGDLVNLLVPASIPPIRGVPAKLSTVQTITEDGRKYFMAGCPKAGASFMVDVVNPAKTIDAVYGKWEAKGDLSAKPPTVLIAEGLATAQSLFEATGLPVACAFDSGNLKAAAENLRMAYPGAAFVICADNDRDNKINVGLTKAKEAALAVGAAVFVPRFGESPEVAGLTDFNDLVNTRGVNIIGSEIKDALSKLNADKEIFVSKNQSFGIEEPKEFKKPVPLAQRSQNGLSM